MILSVPKHDVGPAHDVPAPPLAHGVRTRKGRNVLPPSGRQAHPQHEEYPNLRPVNTERAEVRRHGGFLELACAHLNHAASNLHGLVAKPRLRQAQPSRIFAKQHRFTDLRRGSLVATAIAMVLQVPLHGKKRPDRAKHLLSRPLLCRPKGVSVCSVVKNTLPRRTPRGETARKPTSKPLSVPPRASVHSVLTGRRPTVRHAPRAARVLRTPGQTDTPYPLAHARTPVSYRQNKVSIRRQPTIMRHKHHPLLHRLCDKHTVKRIIME